MKPETNTYFTKMDSALNRYSTAYDALMAEKADLILNDCDSAALDALYEREKALSDANPVSSAQNVALSAWRWSRRNCSSIFELETLPWYVNLHEFLQTLVDAQVTEFAITAQDKKLIDFIYRLVNEEGCELLGTCKVDHTGRSWYIEGESLETSGILFRLGQTE